MKYVFFYLAIIGWTLGLIVHLLSIADYNAADKVPFIWLLHVGIFIVWLPAVLMLTKNKELKAFRQLGSLKQLNPIVASKIFFGQTPTWLTIIAVAGFFYAIINFVLFMTTSQMGVPDFKNGQYILHNHGKLIKTLSEGEYYHYKTNEVRFFSGHWLLFYGLAAAVLFPFNQQKEKASANNT